MATYQKSRSGATASAIWEGIKRLPATIAALSCAAVGVFYNAEFAKQFGEAAIALAVAADVLKTLAGPALMAAIRAGEYGRAVAAGCVLCITLIFSLVAAFGSASHVRETATDGRTELIRAFDDADKRAKALDQELAILGNPRPADLIQAEVAGAKIDMNIWRRSKQCADITREESKTACQPTLALYRERGAAARKLQIDGELETLRPTLSKGRPANADPQAAAISAVTGLDQDTVRRMVSALVVLAIEVGAIGGSIMAAKPMPKTAPVAANDAAPAPQKPRTPAPTKPRGKRGPRKDDNVVAFVEQFRKRNGRNPSIPEMQAALAGIARSTAHRYASAA